ncbi:MAG TPA: DUF5312 family protein [Spirochaetia bacterium]|nr:DUF5312 family protein [Spirochaetia bacterium]
MAEFTVFDKLVSSLSSSERRDMLQRIASSVQVAEPNSQVSDDRVIDLDESYRQMGLFRRLVVLLIAFFTGRERLSVVESYLLRDLGRKVNATLPHGFDSVQQQLRPGAAEDFRRLAESARRFSGVLGRVMGRERKAFVAFLAGLHAPEVQEQLVRDTDPFRIGAAQPELREGDVKRRALNEVEESIATLSPTLRQRIYTDVRSLHQLMTLSSFPFDRLISVFQPVAGGDAVPAPLSRIVDELARLAGVFEGLRQDPSGVLFEALGLFQEQDRLEEDDASVERIVQENVDSLSSAYSRIREFPVHYPLSDLVRIAHANIHFRPTTPGGGEDWLAHWKSFWRERVDSAHRRYAYQRRVDAIVGKAQTALNLTDVGQFPGYPPSGLDDPARHGLSTGILRSVMEEVYEREVAGPVGMLYREGEFYKSDNRADMDRAWHAMQRLATDVANLEVRLRPTGDLGMSWAQTEDDSIPADAARERQLVLVATIDSDASALLHRATETFRLLGEILQGVLYGTVGGRYDTVSNLAELGGRNAAAFTTKLESAHVKCKAVAEVLTDLQNTETSIDSP